MKITKKILLLIISAAILLTACGSKDPVSQLLPDLPTPGTIPETAEEVSETDSVTAETMRLMRTQGGISLRDEDGTEMPIQENMRLFSGTRVQTEEDSSAGISLDDVKAATVGELSLAELIQENRFLLLRLEEGELYFSVAEPLGDDEEFNIETSNMTLGIRGTSGYISAVNEDEAAAILTSGHAVITSNGASQEISAGQRVYITIKDGTATFNVTDISPEEYPALLREELLADEGMLDQVAAQNGDGYIDQMSAVEAYSDIIADAAAYDYGTELAATGYDYAFVTINQYAPVPALLLRQNTDDYMQYVRMFQYDASSDMVLSPEDSIEMGVAQIGGFRGGLSMLSDGTDLIWTTVSGMSGATTVSRVRINGNSLSYVEAWSGTFDSDLPANLASDEIIWNDISGFGGKIDSALPKDGDRTVFTGTLHFYSLQEMLAAENITDANAIAGYEMSYPDGTEFCVIVLDEPQTMLLTESRTGNESGLQEFSGITMIGVNEYVAEDLRQYDGEHHIFSIDPATTGFYRTDVHLPSGPETSDVRVLQ